MKYKSKKKDLNNRYLFKKIEIYNRSLKFLCLYSLDNFNLFLKNFFLLHSVYKTKIRNFCVISGRSRSVIKKLRVSRFFFRLLGSKGYYFGLKKAS
jgi:ribosomal protein S14